MKAVVNFFQDNAMFYKDITQWLRNRTFASLFFGLLLIAEALSLFIIAGSEDINNPGASMFYTLFLVLMVYAMLIAYLGNNLTSREFVNRTFELYELSGMSLERMVGGKILSMLYQFFFGFFCLVPFMFFAYFLGGLDFLEMLVGVAAACVFALPLYLVSLMAAFTGRFKQVNMLTKLASVFILGWFVLAAFSSFFSNDPFLQTMVRSLTEQLKLLFSGSDSVIIGFVMFWLIYVQVCLLLFYFCCDSISRESDSREVPIKVLIGSLIVSWMAVFAIRNVLIGYQNGTSYLMCVPVFLTLLALGVRTFYNRIGIPPIVARQYRDASGFRAALYAVVKPGIVGSVRSMFLLIILAVAAGSLAVFAPPLATSGISPVNDELIYDWWSGASLLIQVPWFLAIPHVFFARRSEVRYNYPAQRTLAVTTWVLVGAVVLVYLAWTRTGIYQSGYSNRDTTVFDVALVTLLSPLPSMSVVGSDDAVVQQLGGFFRIITGIIGMYLMLNHMRAVLAHEAQVSLELNGTAAEGVCSFAVSAPETESDVPAASGPSVTHEVNDVQ